MEHEQRNKLEKKERRNRLEMLTEFQKEIKEKEKGIEEKKLITKEKEDKAQFATKRLGPEKFQKPEVEVLLTEQLPSKLRHVKSHFDPVKDRFKNLQKRNLIETRTFKRYNNRYKTKFMEKYAYKVFTREQAKQYANL